MSEPTPGDKREARADAVAIIEARKYAELIVQEVRERLFRYLDMEVLATTMDDHTKSLSERMEHLENEYGEIRRRLDWFSSRESAKQEDERDTRWYRLKKRYYNLKWWWTHLGDDK